MLTGPQHIAVTNFFKGKLQELSGRMPRTFSYDDVELPHFNTDGVKDGVQGRMFTLHKYRVQHLSLTCYNNVHEPSELIIVVPKSSTVDEKLVDELRAFARTTFNLEPTIQR